MISDNHTPKVLYENLDTSFVNLWALLRYLSQRSFVGRVHVALENYSADVFLNGRESPLVHEVDREAGTDVVEEAALHRLVLRVRESSGSVTVYEGAEESVPPAVAAAIAEPQAATPEAMRSSAGKDDDAETVVVDDAATVVKPVSSVDSGEAVQVAGELIAAVERAASSLGFDFAALFREARISLADDYPFLDPMTGGLRYENSLLGIDGDTVPQGFVTAITETLRRVVDKIAIGEKARRTRERIALELARPARKHDDAMARVGFKSQLNNIAGTEVI